MRIFLFEGEEKLMPEFKFLLTMINLLFAFGLAGAALYLLDDLRLLSSRRRILRFLGYLLLFLACIAIIMFAVVALFVFCWEMIQLRA